MTLFDVFSKREAGDTGLPQQVSDEELLSWGLEIQRLPDSDDIVIDLRSAAAPPRHAARRPLVAAPEPPRRALRARPLIAAPVTQLD